MSALALVLQDANGPLAFSSRKAPSGGAQEGGADEDFGSALTQTANDAAASDAAQAMGPTGAPQKTKSADPRRDLADLAAKAAVDAPASTAVDGASSADVSIPLAAAPGDAGFWRDLAAFAAKATTSSSDRSSAALPGAGLTTTARLALSMAATRLTAAAGATPEQKAASPATATAALTLPTGADPASTAEALAPKNLPELKLSGDTKISAATITPRQFPPMANSSEVLSAGLADGPSASPLRQTASLAVPTADSRPKKPSASLAAPSATPTTTVPADPTLASLLATTPTKSAPTVSLAAASGAPSDEDSVARIGATLASGGSRSAPTGGTAKTSAATRVDDDIALATTEEGTTTSVHVVAQQTWLQPVSAAFSPGLNRVAAADRAALEASSPPGKPSVGAADAKPPALNDAPPALPAGAPPAPAATLPAAATAMQPLAGAGPLATENSSGAPIKAALASSSAAPDPTTTTSLAATPRRDLEITLEPKELGGLAVRMKSAGDRLEIAFVADKGETARMLSDKSATLESQLHDAGIGLGGIDISASSAGAGTGAGEYASSNGGRPASSSGGGASGESDSTPQQQDTSGRNRQEQNHETSEKTSDSRSRADRGLYL